jgi:carbamate kinase
VLETESIRALLGAGTIVIAAGGGGVPVRAGPSDVLEGVPGIVDKDHTSAVLALALSIPRILDLTNVEHVQLHHGTPRAQDLHSLTVVEARERLSEGHFGEGTMRPKIEAAIRFLEGGGEAFDITTPARALDAFEGRAGTRLRRRA